jgi:hypothetical protein
LMTGLAAARDDSARRASMTMLVRFPSSAERSKVLPTNAVGCNVATN